MSNVALFRPSQIAQYLLSVETSLYVADADAIINPDVSALSAVPVMYWKRSGNLVVEMTQVEKDALDAARAASVDAAQKSSATALPDNDTDGGISWRALALMLLDEFNALRQWTVDFKAATAAATSLANLQTRVAALPTLDARTLAQAKASYSNKISTGAAD